MPTPDPRTFDHLPEQFDRFAQLRGAELAAYLGDRLLHQGSDQGGRAVDLGCGTGRHLDLLAGRYREVLAVDLSAPMLAYAQAHHPHRNVTYQQRDLQTVHPDTHGVFDLVLSVNTLHHVTNLAKALTQIKDLLTPGGQAILVDVAAAPEALGTDGLVPRSWWVEEALRTFANRGHQAADAIGRQPLVGSRHLAEAFELLELMLHPGWLAHVAADRLLTPARFDEIYLSAFPGGVITKINNLRAIHYQHTTQDAAG